MSNRAARLEYLDAEKLKKINKYFEKGVSYEQLYKKRVDQYDVFRALKISEKAKDSKERLWWLGYYDYWVDMKADRPFYWELTINRMVLMDNDDTCSDNGNIHESLPAKGKGILDDSLSPEENESNDTNDGSTSRVEDSATSYARVCLRSENYTEATIALRSVLEISKPISTSYKFAVLHIAQLLKAAQQLDASIDCMLSLYQSMPSPFSLVDGICIIATFPSVLGRLKDAGTTLERPSSAGGKKVSPSDEQNMTWSSSTSLLDVYPLQLPRTEDFVTVCGREPGFADLDLNEVGEFARLAHYRSRVLAGKHARVDTLDTATVKPQWLQDLERAVALVETQQHRNLISGKVVVEGDSIAHLSEVHTRLVLQISTLCRMYTRDFGESSFTRRLRVLTRRLVEWKLTRISEVVVALNEAKSVAMQEEKQRNLEFYHVHHVVAEPSKP
ncbi:hypothetical protein PF008_g26274 [Phytophthora fragariae]|uniref:Uncharacterized protein n=1 Tax=Phytophthora fragariae TaxID=53985 RepID=A0A6G0QIG2_9STRA|nr:hypothetical protein PF008_g26274 [Phytophthora fragariae]